MPVAVARHQPALGGPDAPTYVTRGLKGLFTRNKVVSPEPVEPTRSRFRTLVDDVSGRAAGLKATQKERTAKLMGALSISRTGGAEGEDKGTRWDHTARPTARPRAQSPEATARRGRVAVAFPPAMQKGNDGKWQPPSLSKGSMSTSALAQLRDGDDDQEEEDDRTARPNESRRPKPALHALFSHGRVDREATFGREKPSLPAQGSRPAVKAHPRSTADPSKGAAPKGTLALPVLSQPPAPARSLHPPPRSPPSPHRPLVASPVHGAGSKHTSQVRLSSDGASPVTSAVRSRSRANGHADSNDPFHSKPLGTVRPSARTGMSDPASTMRRFPPSPTVRHRSDPKPSEHLSLDHYHLRLATSFLLKTLTPVIKGSAFASSDRNADMKRLADERLASLGRIEKNWGSDWIRAAAAGMEQSDSGDAGLKKGLVRVGNIGDRAKERERKGFLDAMRDGVLLCLYLNLLFLAQPSHISRISMTDNGLTKTTNLVRFAQACQTLGLANDKTFAPSDMTDGGEVCVGRVAFTIVSLARLAGRGAGMRSKSPDGTRSPTASRPSSRGASMTPPGSPPSRHKVLITATPPITPVRPGYASRPTSPTCPSPPQSRIMERTRSADSANDLQTKLQVVTEIPSPVPSAGSVPSTPNMSGFSASSQSFSPSGKVALLPRQSLNHSQTQPYGSPSLRPRSSQSNSSSGTTTPTHVRRPSLRPRNTTGNVGTGTRVSFAENEPVSAITDTSGRSSISSLGIGQNIGLHAKERTPSLISGTSRTTSAYTRSSAAYSALTTLGDITDDPAIAVDLDGEISPNGSAIIRDRSRRNSEKTLHDARQKFIGSLLTPEDILTVVRRSSDIHDSQEDSLRAEAFSKSLAALEGGGGMRASPNRPSNVKRGSSSETARQERHPVVEEEESRADLHSVQSPASGPPASHSKFYVSSRSMSPTPLGPTPDPSPTMPVFNNALGVGSRPMSRSSSRTSVDARGAGGVRMERRQSDRMSMYCPKYAMSSSDVGGPHGQIDRNENRARLNSMVTSSSSSRRSGERNGQSRPVSLLMLEFEGAGGEIVRYQMGGSIGRGQCGVVYKALNMSNGQMVAVKRISLEGMDDKQVQDVMKEVELLKTLSHPSIVKYEGMKRDEETLDIILEYAENGSLGSLIKDFGSLSETLVASYTAKILEGLDYLHTQGVIHRDLKAANILSTKNGNIKLSDFGVSLNTKAVENIKQEVMTVSKNGAKPDLSDVVGTPNWMAPEVIDLTGASFASDIWSLGCTIIELLTGLPPYSDIKNSLSVMYRIVEDDDPPIPPGLPEHLDHFLRLCFKKNPNGRPSAMQLFEHPWLLKHCPELSLLRGQDSVPFLRRFNPNPPLPSVSTGHLFPEGPGVSRIRPLSSAASTFSDPESDVTRKRLSFSEAIHSTAPAELKSHQLVKTTFAKAIICRVCHSRAKAGVLCQDCGLVCHANCVTKEVNRCDPLEQLALYTRQRELSITATAGDSTASLGHYPLESDPHSSSPGGNIWKRSKGLLERRGSNLLHSNSRENLSPSPVGGRSASSTHRSPSRASQYSTSGLRGKENEQAGISATTGAEHADDHDTIRQAIGADVNVHTTVTDPAAAPKTHVRGKDSKSDCVIM